MTIAKMILLSLLLASAMLVAAHADQRLTAADYHPAAQQAGNPLALKVFDILRENCAECHGDNGEDKDKFWLNYQSMLKDKLVIPGKPDDSSVYTVVKSEKMPRDAPASSAEQIAAIKEWILAGAPDWNLKNDKPTEKTRYPCPSAKAIK